MPVTRGVAGVLVVLAGVVAVSVSAARTACSALSRASLMPSASVFPSA